MHGQVTHALSLHSFECWSLVSSYVGGSVFFSHPTRSLLSRFPSPLSQDTSVSDTSVSPGQYFQVSRLCIAKPTAWKRGCGQVKSPPSPHCQKRERCNACFFLRVNVGPKSTIRLLNSLDSDASLFARFDLSSLNSSPSCSI